MRIEEGILKGILVVIEKIADTRFQQAAWVENTVHPYAIFEESMHQLFDDYELSAVLSDYKNYGISDEQHVILNEFYDMLNQYSDEKMSWLQTVNPKELLTDPKWHKIQKTAKEVLKIFNYKKK
jgi:hypothetical protein